MDKAIGGEFDSLGGTTSNKRDASIKGSHYPGYCAWQFCSISVPLHTTWT